MANASEKKKNGIVVCLSSGQAVSFVLVSLAVVGLSFSLGMKAGKSLPPEAANESTAESSDRLGALDARAESRADTAEQKAREQAAAMEKESNGEEAISAGGGAEAGVSEAAAAAPASADASKKAAVSSSGDTAAAPPAGAGERAPIKPSAPSPAASPDAPQKKRTGFALQTSSLPSEKSAQDEVRRLIRRGLDAWYSPAEVKGATTYRVKVGPYATREEAMADFDRITEKAGGKPMLANAE